MKNDEIRRLVLGDFAVNCYVYPLSGGAECAVVDPGAGTGAITGLLKQLGLTPRYILLTHGHFDHIGALASLVREWRGSGADLSIAIHRTDGIYLGPDALDVHRESFGALGGGEWLERHWDTPPAADILLEDGDTVGPFTVLHLPGHTPGSAGFLNRENGILFSGDTLFSAGVGRTDLPGGDHRALEQSLVRLFAMDKTIRVYPGHGGETAIGRKAARYGM